MARHLARFITLGSHFVEAMSDQAVGTAFGQQNRVEYCRDNRDSVSRQLVGPGSACLVDLSVGWLIIEVSSLDVGRYEQ